MKEISQANRALTKSSRAKIRSKRFPLKKTCLDFVIPSLHDTILSPSCTVRCPGVTGSLVFLYIYIYIYIYICVCVCVCVCGNACMYICVCVWVSVYTMTTPKTRSMSEENYDLLHGMLLSLYNRPVCIKQDWVWRDRYNKSEPSGHYWHFPDTFRT